MRTNSVKSCSSLGSYTRGMHHSDHSNPSEASPFTIWRKILPCTALDCNKERQVWETKHSSSGAWRISIFRLVTWILNASQHYPSQLRGQVNQNPFAVLRDSITAFVRWIMLFHRFSRMVPCELAFIKSVFHYASNISHLKQFPIPFWKVTPNIKRKRCLRPFLGQCFSSTLQAVATHLDSCFKILLIENIARIVTFPQSPLLTQQKQRPSENPEGQIGTLAKKILHIDESILSSITSNLLHTFHKNHGLTWPSLQLTIVLLKTSLLDIFSPKTGSKCVLLQSCGSQYCESHTQESLPTIPFRTTAQCSKPLKLVVISLSPASLVFWSEV